jgi:sugar phosphate isomerase/epimerase
MLRRAPSTFLDEARFKLDRWQDLSREFGVRICYHTHCGPCLGMNAAGLETMLRGFDPTCIGAYIDPAHLVVNGEDFDLALAMLEPHLAAVALKDVRLRREETNGHGRAIAAWVRAGEGMVDWTLVFDRLKRAGFNGPFSVHCEFETTPDQLENAVKNEIQFFRERL